MPRSSSPSPPPSTKYPSLPLTEASTPYFDGNGLPLPSRFLNKAEMTALLSAQSRALPAPSGPLPVSAAPLLSAAPPSIQQLPQPPSSSSTAAHPQMVAPAVTQNASSSAHFGVLVPAQGLVPQNQTLPTKSATKIESLARHGVVRVGDELVPRTAPPYTCRATISKLYGGTCYQDYQITVVGGNANGVTTTAQELHGPRDLRRAANALWPGLEATEHYDEIEVWRNGATLGSLDYLRRVFDANRPQRGR